MQNWDSQATADRRGKEPGGPKGRESNLDDLMQATEVEATSAMATESASQKEFVDIDYYFDNLPTDQCLPHITDPTRPVSPETLAKPCVLSWHVPVDGHESGVDEADDDFEVNKVAKERGYKNRDVINVSREGMGSVYEEKIRGFFEEHMHEDEEIRHVLRGEWLC
ncbi:1,2-dihydroxy-3-keto-5-methylthiopentene dioxygenase [Mycena sanguinolenta]|uniref:acireductone dioxygenase (Fe(2+)-requiring) n=1 Tax=Mycena sanguinolenta TaxID=230812 RepID=A0A8H7CZ59_9AGAR|nr:1,2-dihydroxy-3-keto-5-methylthiopentene dioxygenase [Mycena sanguinolenta]